MKLEELARQSSDAARFSVVNLEPRPIGDGARNASRTPRVLAFAALLLIVGVGVTLFAAGRDDDHSEELDLAEEVTLPKLALGDPAAFGFGLVAAFDAEHPPEGATAADAEGTFAYYGDPDADDPFADGDLLLAAMPLTGDDPGSGLTSATGSVVTVRDVNGSLTSGAAAGLPDGTTALQWTEPAGPSTPAFDMVLASRDLSDEALLEVAESLDLPGGAGTPAVSVGDAGLELVAVSEGLPEVLSVGRGSRTAGSVAAYSQSRGVVGEEASVVVSSSEGTLRSAVAAARWWATDVARVEVNGNEAWMLTHVFSEDDPSSGSLLWSPDASVVASMLGYGIDGPDALVTLAESVVELDDAAWDELLATAGSSADPAEAMDEPWLDGSGDFEADGGSVSYNWALGINDGSLCFDLSSGTGSSGTCQEGDSVAPPDADTALIVSNGADDLIETVLIAAAPGVSVIESAGVDGGSITVSSDVRDGIVWVVYVGPIAGNPLFDVLVDGEVVATLEPDEGTPAVEEVPPAPESGSASEESAPSGLPFDPAENSSAIALGIVDDLNAVASGGNDRVDWIIGESGGQAYFVAEGEATFAAALVDDLTVLRPVEMADGSLMTYIVAREVPSCLSLMGTSAVTTAQPDESTLGDRLVAWPAPGAAEGWRLLFRRSSTREEVWVPVPDIEGSGPWPADICPT